MSDNSRKNEGYSIKGYVPSSAFDEISSPETLDTSTIEPEIENMQTAPQRRGSWWVSSLWTLIYVIMFVLSQAVATVIVMGVVAARGFALGISDGSINLENQDSIDLFIDSLIATQLPLNVPWIMLGSFLLALLLCWLVAKLRKFDMRKHAGLNPTRAAVVFVALFAGIGFSMTFNAFFNMPGMEHFQDPDTQLAQSLLLGSIFTAIVASTIVPIVEEVIFRGFILNELRRGFALIPSMLISSLIFGILHGTAAWALVAAVLGLAMAWIALRTRSVYPAIAAHAGVNGASFTFVWLEPSEMSTFVMLLIIGFTLFAAMMVLLTRDSKPLSSLEPAPEPLPKGTNR